MARPKGSGKPVDLKTLENYARIGATQIEIAAACGMSVATLERRLQQKRYREVLDKGRADMYISLRTKQVQLALAGNPTMLIWLGKQCLGQKDKIEHAGVGPGGAIPVAVSASERLLSRLRSLAAGEDQGSDNSGTAGA